MSYIGNQLQTAFPSYLNIDDISGSFDGVTTSFALTVGGVAPVPAPASSNQCLISVGGVVQRPDDSGTEGFRLSGGNIIFSSAPTGGDDFFGVVLAGADYLNVGVNYPSGTAGAPSITFNTDLDTGIYNSGANEIGFTTSGTERLVITSAGQIKTAASGTAASPALVVGGDVNSGLYSPGADQVAISTNGTGRLFVDASGNTTINGICDVRAVANRGRLLIDRIEGSYDSPTAVTTSAEVGAVLGRGYDGASYRSVGSVSFTSDGAVGSTSSPGFITFATTPPASTTPQERLRITSDGKVGIGTSSPGVPLEVFGGNARVALGAGSPATFRGYEFASATTVFGSIKAESSGGELRIESGFATFGGFQTFYTNGLERARIDSSGRLLVGTSSADTTHYAGVGKVFIEGTGDASSSLVQTCWNAADTAQAWHVLAKSGGASVGTRGIVASGELLGAIAFEGDDGTNFIRAAQIRADVDGTPGANDMPGRLVFSTTADGASSPTEQLRITSDRYIRLASGTGGIQFNGDTAAANALDDYEEGTFTPTIVGTSTAGTGTYSNQVGRYTKIGNRVIFNLYVVWTAHTGTGNIAVDSLPFTTSSVANSFATVTLWHTNLTLTAGNTSQAYCPVSSTRVVLQQVPTGGGLAVAIPMDTAADIMIAGSYVV